MTYFQELRANWRPVLGAMIGLSCGFMAMAFTNNIMGPPLIHAFGWSKAQFALTGTLGAMTLIALPITGRVVDTFGVRRTALVGVVTAPITFFILSRMSGNFGVFVTILLIQNLLCMTTTTTVMTRTVVQHVVRARGVALAIVASGPALTIAIAGPLLNNFVTAHGWRAGYLVLTAYTLIGGFLALALVPPDRGVRREARAHAAKAAKRDYGTLLRMPAFWVLLGGIILTHLSQFISNGQLSVLLLDHGMAPGEISGMIAVFAIGTLAGRFACGAALDRFSAPMVAAFVTGAPAVGLFMIASNINTPLVLGSAVLLRGLSYGAEADLIGYLVARIFGVRIFGTVLGLMAASISLGSSGGALLLSLTLRQTGSYQLFLIVSGVLAILGSLLFLLLPSGARPEPEVDEIEAMTATAPSAG